MRMRVGRASRKRCGARARVERRTECVELFERDVPLPREDVGGELSPVRGDVQVRVGGEDAEVIEVVRGARIVPASVLELSKVIQGGYLFEGELWK